MNEMTNGDLFENIFGIYATELWSMTENDFLNWLNAEVDDMKFSIKSMTNSQLLKAMRKELGRGEKLC